ncbi:TonB-dependent receptor [Olivibacter sitiensis]|uniref:TonB-dependent receptor n=1 Tax=Olivibacter sitiensis TaxID=376470 RepID=UPI0003F90CF0|nr:TonB-dependent receptor [Olivibacter sitiensis]
METKKCYIYPLFIILLLLLKSKDLLGQTTVKGVVTDQRRRAIPFASVSIKGSYDGASTDSMGRFLFQTRQQSTQTLLVKALNFETDSLNVNLNELPDSLHIRLMEKANMLNTVTISAGNFVSGIQGKGIALNALDIATTPGMAADVFGAMQTLPGAQLAFGESGLMVRGGAPAETKTFIDGMLMKNPINAQVQGLSSRARFSAFNFRSTDFSTSGYSAQFGQALSSVLSLQTNDLPKKTSTSIRLLSVGGEVQQNIRHNNSGLVLTASLYDLKPSYTYINKSQIDWQQHPKSNSIGAQFIQKTSAIGLFKYYMDYSDSKMGIQNMALATDTAINPTGVRDDRSLGAIAIRNRNSYINSTYQDMVGEHWKLETGLAYNYAKDHIALPLGLAQRIDQSAQLRAVATYFIGTLSSLRFGTESFYTHRKDALDELFRAYQEQLTAAFTEADVFFNRKMVLRTGLRSEYSSYLRRFNVSPRLALSYKLNANSQVAANYGLYYQNPADKYLLLTRLGFEAVQGYVANYEFKKTDYNFRSELYYKRYSQLVREHNGILSNNGDGYARGLDLFWRDRKTLKNAEYRISYSFLDTERLYMDYPVSAVPTFASKHTFNVFWKKYLSAINTQVGAGYLFATGRSYYNPNNAHFLGDKAPNYHNTSLNANYITSWFKQLTVIYLNVDNVVGNRQVFGYQYAAGGGERQTILPATRRNILFGIIVTIGDKTFYD